MYPGVAGISKAERQAVTYLYSGITAISIDGIITTTYTADKTTEAFTAATAGQVFTKKQPGVTWTN